MNDDTGYRSGHPTTREGIYESLTYAKLNHVHRPDRWPSIQQFNDWLADRDQQVMERSREDLNLGPDGLMQRAWERASWVAPGTEIPAGQAFFRRDPQGGIIYFPTGVSEPHNALPAVWCETRLVHPLTSTSRDGR